MPIRPGQFALTLNGHLGFGNKLNGGTFHHPYAFLENRCQENAVNSVKA